MVHQHCDTSNQEKASAEWQRAVIEVQPAAKKDRAEWHKTKGSAFCDVIKIITDLDRGPGGWKKKKCISSSLETQDKDIGDKKKKGDKINLKESKNHK